MLAAIDEDRAQAHRLGFADGAPGSVNPAELWPRVWFTLGALIVYRIGSYLPIPGLDLIAVRNHSRLDLFAGGSIPDLSIFSLGVLPYISAFVIVQLLSRILPRPNAPCAGYPSTIPRSR
jgi:hypothetical protein